MINDNFDWTRYLGFLSSFLIGLLYVFDGSYYFYIEIFSNNNNVNVVLIFKILNIGRYYI